MDDENYGNDDIELDAEAGPQSRSTFDFAERIWRAENKAASKRHLPKTGHSKPYARLIEMAVRDVRNERRPGW